MRRPLFAVCLAITCVIAFWYWLYPPSLPDKVPAKTEEILIYGRIDRKEHRNTYGKEQFILYLSDYSIYSGTSESALNFLQTKSEKQETNQIMCYTASTDREPKMGSFVLVRGNPEDFDRATNPGEFDSRLYYATLGIDFRVKNGEVLWESDSYSVFKEGLWKLRCLWQERLDDVLSDDAAAVMKTMLLGDKASLDRELKGLYQEGGIAHILAISGLHISLIGMGIYRLLRKIRVPIWLAAVLGSICILAYGSLTGAGVSTGRAVWMFLIRMLAEVLGRSYDLLTALGLLLLLMVLQQPLYLYHSGFLLSFSALFGIGLLRPALSGNGLRNQGLMERALRNRAILGSGLRNGLGLAGGPGKRILSAMRTLKENFLTSLAVTLATTPVTFLFFYETPVYGVLLNLLVLPSLPIVMYLGLTVLLLPEGVWLHIPAVVIEVILSVFEWLCECSLYLPGQKFIRGKPEVWQICIYVLLLVIVWLGKQGSKGNIRGDIRRGGIPLKGRVVILCVAVSVLCFKGHGNAEITFLDVGQGDSICIQTSGGSAYLIDCGSSSESSVGKYVVAPFLKSEGISYLEAIIITHPDADHYNGLEELLEEGYAGRIARLLLPDIPQEDKNEAYMELEQLADFYGIKVGYLSAGMQWEDGGMTFTCLHPWSVAKGATGVSETTAGSDAESSNAYSVVLHVESNIFSALLTGDIEGDGEKQLAEVLQRAGIAEVTVLKVAHHGSRYSTTEEFLEVLDARLAVISCGAENWYGHPHEETLSRLGEDGTMILTTPENGAVRIEISVKSGIKVQCVGFYYCTP